MVKSFKRIFTVAVAAMLLVATVFGCASCSLFSKGEEENNLFEDGLALVQATSGKYGYVNEKGVLKIAADWDEAREFSNGYAIVGRRVDVGSLITGQYTAIDKKGKKITEDTFYSLGDFAKNKLAFAKKTIDGKYGYINNKGEVVIDYKYDSVEGFTDNGLAIVGIFNKDKFTTYYGIINAKGEEVVEIKYAEIKYKENAELYYLEVPSTSTGKLCGFADNKGKVVVEADKYPFVLISNNKGDKGQLIKVTKDGHTCFVNTKGKEVFEITNDKYAKGDVGGFHNGLVVATTNHKEYHALNEKGEVAFQLSEDIVSLDSFTESGLAVFRNKDGKYGYVNKKGEIVIEAKYDYAIDFGMAFDDKTFVINRDEKANSTTYILIDKKGKELANFGDWMIYGFADGKLVGAKENKDTGKITIAILDMKGNVKVEIEDKDITDVKVYDDAIVFEKKSSDSKSIYGIMNFKGKVIVEAKYYQIGYDD